MHLRHLHPWDVSPREAAAIQQRLAAQVVATGGPSEAQVRYVAGADIAFVDRREGRQPTPSTGSGRSLARGALVLLSYPELSVVESVVVEAPVTFPYIPGLLAFREVPALAQAFEKLRQAPDLLLVDGHGYSHPRRFGIACHLGLLLEVPTIGCAKSRLCGEHAPPAEEVGARSELRDGPEVIGLVLRPAPGLAPLYVSVGHRIGLDEAAQWVLRLYRPLEPGKRGHRLPEPTRLADQLSKGLALSPSKEQPQPAAEQPRLF